MNMPTRAFAIIIACHLVSATLTCAAPPVLRWDGPAAGTNAWNAVSTNWLDALESPVVWQPGAIAQFDGAGGTVTVTDDLTASNLTFAASGYTLSGAGRLTVDGGGFTAAAATENTVSSELRSRTALAKTGDGTVTLANPSALLTNTVTVSAGTLALRDTAIPGAVTVASGATLAALPPAATGLMGFYYNVTPNGANFTSLDVMENHFASLVPDLVAPSGLAGANFDFGSTGTLFPMPYAYNSGGSRTNNFEVVWRGTLTVPTGDYYTFRITHDDGILLALDGQTVANRLANSVTEGTAYLSAGAHDMVLGLYQGIGPSAMQIQVKSLYGAFMPLPNAWLSPYTSVGTLSGAGSTALSAGGTSFRTQQSAAATLSGALSGPAGSRLTKAGASPLTLASSTAVSNALAGDVAVVGGVLSLATDERVGDSSTVQIGPGAALNAAASETLGALTGPGTVLLGNNTAVRVIPFTGDTDCGVSSSKTYTHLLDFPDNGNPATVNGVTFLSAGMSGSTNGFAWSVTGNSPNSAWNDAPNDSTRTGVDRLLWDFQYNGTDYTLTLSGLTPGQSYESRLYFRSFGTPNPNSPRKLTFFFSTGSAFLGSMHYCPDAQYARSILSCRYTADASGSLSLRVFVHNSGHTCHLYGLSNEQAAAPAAPSAPAAAYPRVVAFANDADSGLSTAKTYTHLLDFPANGNPATVNGVDFLAAGMSGSAFGYGWNTTGTAPTGVWNGDPNDSTRAGVDRLLWDFLYNSTDFTLHLTGLTPGRTYETRLYFRFFGSLVSDSPRDITATFTAGSSVVGSVPHDLDTMTRSRIECRYTADAAGSVSIRIVSVNAGSTCHLYGLSNEEVNQPAVLTLDTPAASAARHTGAIAGNGTLVKRGQGTQRLGGVNSLATPLEVQEGTLALEPGASLLAGANVAAGATLAAPYGGATLGGLTGDGTFSLAGQTLYPATNLLFVTYFTNDLMTGISPSKTYTHLLDLGTRANVAVINGVTFNKVSSQNGSLNGYGWANFPPNPHGGGTPPADHGVPAATGIYDLLYDMTYGWSYPSAATMQLTGLVPGRRYEVHLFNRSWGWNGSRWQTVTFDPDGAGPITESLRFNPDAMNANYVAYRYTAVSTTLDITILSDVNNQTLHLYGLTNEEIADAAYAPAVISLAADSTFDGLITGAGGWAKEGSGTLTLAGSGDATGPVTVRSGTLAAALSGSLGGDVTVAGGATLRAGTASACGALTVGGDLTFQSGALPVWRYASGAHDVITVGGVLSLPSNGVLRVESLTPGLKPPALATVFASSEVIDGPANLSGWTVEGVDNARLIYSADRTDIRFHTPRGTVILIR